MRQAAYRLLSASALGVFLAASSAAQFVQTEDAQPAPTTSAVSSAPISFPGLGRRVAADGDLALAAGRRSALVYELPTGTVEATDLLLLPGQPYADVVEIGDVALEGDLAALFVRRGDADLTTRVLVFERSAGPPASWAYASEIDVVIEPGTFVGSNRPPPADVPIGQVHLRDGVLWVVFNFLEPDFTSPDFLPEAFIARYDLTQPSAPELIDLLDSSSWVQPTGEAWFGGDTVLASALGDGPEPGSTLLAMTLVPTTEIGLAFGITQCVVTQRYQVDGPNGLGPWPSVIGHVDGPQQSDFGTAVALVGQRLVVGDPEAAGGEGRVEIHDAQTGVLEQVLASPSPHVGDRFGRRLAVSDGGLLLAVSEIDNDATPTLRGAGFVRIARASAPGEAFVLGGDALNAPGFDEVAGGDAGSALAFAAGRTLVVGAAGTDEVVDPPGAIDGTVSAIELPEDSWFELDLSPALAGTGGVAPTQVLEGGVYADAPLVLGVRDAAPFSTTYMILGLSTIRAPAKGGIVHPSLDLLTAFPTNGQGEFVLPTLWPATSAALGPFDIFTQWWVADAGGPVGFSATSGGVIHQD